MAPPVGDRRAKLGPGSRVDQPRAVRLINRADRLVLANDADRLLQESSGTRAGRRAPGGHRLRQPFGHERDVAGPPVFDRRGSTETRCPSAVLNTSLVGRLLDRQAGDHPAVGQAATTDRKLIADRGARAQDRADQLVAAVLDADRREVGPDPLAPALHAVAARTGICPGAEEDELSPFPASALAADQLADRRQAAARRPSWAGAESWRPGRESAGRDTCEPAWSPRSSGPRAACRHRPAR